MEDEVGAEMGLNTQQVVAAAGGVAELHTDILTGNIESVKRKLETGAVDVNCIFKFTLSSKNCGSRLVRERLLSISSTPLHTACISRRLPLVKLLLDCGAEPNMLDSQQRIPALLVLLYWPRIRPKTCQAGMTRAEKSYQLHVKKLHETAAQTLKMLIEKGTLIGNPVTMNSEHLTHIAARYNLVQALEILLKYNAPLDPEDNNGVTPMLLAAGIGNFHVVKLLIERGANRYHTDGAGMGLLHYLAQTDRSQGSKYLGHVLAGGFRAKHARNHHGQTALHVACQHSNEAAIHTLIMHGLDPDTLDNAGSSPLFELLNRMTSLDAVYGLELLLQWTIHPKIHNKTGLLPGWLNHPNMCSLREKLLSVSKDPPTLERICKVTIRRHMGMRRLNPYDIKKLPCPVGLANIILYNTAEWWQ
jgi:ankyrin repeat protein